MHEIKRDLFYELLANFLGSFERHLFFALDESQNISANLEEFSELIKEKSDNDYLNFIKTKISEIITILDLSKNEFEKILSKLQIK